MEYSERFKAEMVQKMLGHVCLGTTEIYTRVSILQLKKVHDATHPSARIHRPLKKAEPNQPGPLSIGKAQ